MVSDRFVPVKQLPRTADSKENQRRRKKTTEIKMQSAQKTHRSNVSRLLCCALPHPKSAFPSFSFSPISHLPSPCSLLLAPSSTLFQYFRFSGFQDEASASPLQSEVHLMPARKEEKIISAKTGREIKVKPDKSFCRLDKPFNDAVRSKKASAVGEVLLRVPISGDKARRTAKKILADRGRRRR